MHKKGNCGSAAYAEKGCGCVRGSGSVETSEGELGFSHRVWWLELVIAMTYEGSGVTGCPKRCRGPLGTADPTRMVSPRSAGLKQRAL